MTGISRRNFLKGAGLAGVSAAGLSLGLVGCAPKSEEIAGTAGDSTATETPAVNDVWAIGEVADPSETVDAQVLILGGGGTGVACALQCLELGLKPLVVEQMGGWGGSFVGTEFIFGPESKYQKATGDAGAMIDTVKDAIKDHMVYHHWYPNREAVTKYFNQAAETIEWLEGHGVKFSFNAGYRMRATAYAHVDENTSIGASFINALANDAEALGVETMFNTRARKILVENGAVTGALVEKENGEVVQINSSAVIICTGGYANNNEFMYSVSQITNENIQAIGMSCRNADGIKMAKDAGALMAEGIGCVMWCSPSIKDAITASWQTPVYAVGMQPTLWVNQDGKRFVNEDLWIDDFSGLGVNFRNQQRTYMIYGENNVRKFEESGPYVNPYTFAPVGEPMPTIREDLASLATVHVADTIEKAAEMVGIDPAALRKTLDTYNAQCEAAAALDPTDTSADEDFGKQAMFMLPVNEGPYYVAEAVAAFYTTCGGIKIDGNLQVVDENNQPIKGLYAGGCDAGTIQGDSYDVKFCGGSAAGWAINSGRLVAKHIAENIA